MKIFKNKIFKDILYTLFCIFLILFIYQILAYIINEEYTLPKLNFVMKEIFYLFGQSFFWKAFCASLLRTIIGFLLSFLFAFIFVLICKYLSFAKRFVNIIVSILRAIPTIAIILNLLFWTNSRVAPIIIACLVTLPQLFSSITAQLDSFDKNIIDMCNLYKVPKKDIFFKVYIPFLIPRLALTLCSNFALTLKLIGSSEALCSTINSLGFLMKDAKISYNPAQLIALSLICIAVAMILEYVLSFIIKKLWRIK